ncbi:50S ribosomal protein L15 [bacterium]|nr:MAG: 50S ribosomal protein L15 [bacterium]
MKYHELEVASKTTRKRVGRGISAGGGKTAGRGTKGQKARTGKKIKPGFEGGQTKLAMRLPKARGFKHARKVSYVEVSLDQLAQLDSKKLDNVALKKAGVIRSEAQAVKVLGGEKLTKTLVVELQAATLSAVASIEEAGGSFTATATPQPRPVKKAEDK